MSFDVESVALIDVDVQLADQILKDVILVLIPDPGIHVVSAKKVDDNFQRGRIVEKFEPNRKIFRSMLVSPLSWDSLTQKDSVTQFFQFFTHAPSFHARVERGREIGD